MTEKEHFLSRHAYTILIAVGNIVTIAALLANFSNRLATIETWKSSQENVLVRMAILEERLTSMKDSNERIEKKLDDALDHKDKQK